MGFLEGKQLSFYPLEGVVLVIEFDKVWCIDLIGVLPSIVAFRVSFPFDEILEGSGLSMTSVAFD